MPDALTLAEAKELLQLCRSGRLYAIEKWIGEGRSLQVPAKSGHTPLQVALDTGFHSLIELLVRHEARQAQKNEALEKAVALRRNDFVELLIAHGAEATSVPFSNVLTTFSASFLEASDPLVFHQVLGLISWQTQSPELTANSARRRRFLSSNQRTPGVFIWLEVQIM